MPGPYLDSQGNVVLGGPIVSAQDHQDRFEAWLVRNLDESAMAGSFRIWRVGSRVLTLDGSPTWSTTLPVTKGPQKRAMIYNGAVDLDLLQGFYYHSDPDSVPGSQYQIDGLKAYDAFKGMWRTWRAALSDPHGVDVGSGGGWHPDAWCALMKNESGAAVLKGDILTRSDASERGFSTTTVEKDCDLVGVAMEGIDDGDWGVVALIGSGAIVDVRVLGSTHDTVTVGDYLITGTVAGSARNGGPVSAPPSTFISSLPVSVTGTPRGAFAVAMEGTSSDGLIPARLLGYVGEGATVCGLADVLATASKSSPIGDGPQVPVDIAPQLLDPGHAPLVSIDLKLDMSVDGGAPGDNAQGRFAIGGRDSPSHKVFHLTGRGGPAGVIASDVETRVVPTDDPTTPTKSGTMFTMMATLDITPGPAEVTAILMGYTY